MDEKEQYVRQIMSMLDAYRLMAKDNPEHFRENAAAIERFSCEILNLCYGYDLKSVSLSDINVPVVDFADPDSKTALRVVDYPSRMKVRAILGKFYENKLEETYDHLIIFGPLSIMRYRTDLFSQECEEKGSRLSLLTMRNIMYQIKMIDDLEVLKKIVNLVKIELSTTLGTTQQDTSVQMREEPRREQMVSDSNDTPFVFISYSHLDFERVQSIIDAMSKKGMCVWWDQDIEPGTPWDETIGQHLFDCKCVVALVTKNFMDSTACLDEIYVGKEKDKLLMVYLEDLELPPKMYRYMRIQDIRFTAETTADVVCERLSKTELLKGCYLQ